MIDRSDGVLKGSGTGNRLAKFSNVVTGKIEDTIVDEQEYTVTEGVSNDIIHVHFEDAVKTAILVSNTASGVDEGIRVGVQADGTGIIKSDNNLQIDTEHLMVGTTVPIAVANFHNPLTEDENNSYVNSMIQITNPTTGLTNENSGLSLGVTGGNGVAFLKYNGYGRFFISTNTDVIGSEEVVFQIDNFDRETIIGFTDGVIVLQSAPILGSTATVFEDLNFAVIKSQGPASTLPDLVTINGVYHKEFTSANNQSCGDCQEIYHSAKLGQQYIPHFHCFLKQGESAGTTGVTFRVHWELRPSNGVTANYIDITVTSAQLTANANLITATAASGFYQTYQYELGGQLSLSIARVGGDAGDVIITTYGVHVELDSMGSNTATAK